MTPTQTWVVLGVLVVLTGLEVAVAMSSGGRGVVTVALFVLAIAQASYFALVAMGLGQETRTMKDWLPSRSSSPASTPSSSALMPSGGRWAGSSRNDRALPSAVGLSDVRAAQASTVLWLLPFMFTVPYVVSAVVIRFVRRLE